MSPTDLNLSRLRATVIDGRCRNMRYRQRQIEALYNGLTSSASSICEAISKDTQSTTVEIEAEFSLAMSAVRSLYAGLDFDEEHENEYLVTKGKDNTTRRVGLGVVVIKPTNHTRFYSVVTTVAPAIAAGNCVVLELEDSLLEVDKILKELIPKLLDNDSFFISNSKIPESELKSCTLVDQTSPTSSNSSNKDRLSDSKARAIAVVDRTANIDSAARALVAARSRFQSTSPYAPDLILVNEFVKKEFVEACMRYVTTQFASSGGSKRSSSNAKQKTQSAIREAEKKGQVETFGSADFMVVDVSNRSTAIVTEKITGSYLVVMPYTSMTDAVSFLGVEETSLAGYFFASIEAGKYLSQQLDCHISFLNQIPVHLLVGPAAPVCHPSSLPYRYSTDLFSVPRPQFVESTSKDTLEVSEVMDKPSIASTRQLRSSAVAPLQIPKPQPLGKAVGFFEQGIFLGMGIALSVVVPVVGYGTYVIGRKSFQLLMRRR